MHNKLHYLKKNDTQKIENPVYPINMDVNEICNLTCELGDVKLYKNNS